MRNKNKNRGNNGNSNKVSSKNTKSEVKRVGKMHKFFFLKPLPNLDANELSVKLLNLEGIEEVYITEGDYGFLVKAKVKDFDKDIGNYISNKMKSKYSIALSYYSFKKK